jgi:hypothetical protein
MSDFSLVPIVFRHFFMCIVPCDVDLRVPLIFVPKASGDNGGITRDPCLYCSLRQDCQNLKFGIFELLV